MKALIYTFPHDLDVWAINVICASQPAIKEKKHLAQLDRHLIGKITFVVWAFLKHGFHRLDYHAMSLQDRNRLKAHKNLPESSSLDPIYRQSKINESRRNLIFKRIRLPFFFYYSLWLMQKYDILFVYNGCTSLAKCLIEAARKLKKKIIFMEVGPFLNTITIDHIGINYENSLPREISFYRQWAQKNPESVFTPDNPKNRPQIEVRDKHIEFQTISSRDLNQKYVFFPLQVFQDSQIAFGDWIDDVQELVGIVQEAALHLPEGWRVITKEHPRCQQRYDILSMETPNFMFANGNETPDLIKNASLIVTLNSSVGLEAMLFDKPVAVLGHAFYAFDGLAHKCKNKEELIQIFKNPEQISFNAEDRRAFLSYLIAEYYLEGNMHKKSFCINEKNQRRVAHLLCQP